MESLMLDYHKLFKKTKVVFVHGNIGVGKSKLLHTFGYLMRQRYTKENIKVITMRESFVHDSVLEKVYERSPNHLFEFQLLLMHHHVKVMNQVLEQMKADMESSTSKTIFVLERSVLDSLFAFYPLVFDKLKGMHNDAVRTTRLAIVKTYDELLKIALHVFVDSPSGGMAELHKVVQNRNGKGDAHITEQYLQAVEGTHEIMKKHMKSQGFKMLELDCEKPFECIDFWGYMENFDDSPEITNYFY